jgi:citrate synthase
MKIYLTATEAAAELGVSIATLYAYVSRGMITSEAKPGSRNRLYRADDVRALRSRHIESPRTEDPLLLTGQGVIESRLTLISEGRLFYRGVEVEELARHASLEAVATLLWDQQGDDPFAGLGGAVIRSKVRPLLSRMISGLTLAADQDVAAHDRSPAGTARTGARILRHLVGLTTGAAHYELPIHAAMAAGWQRAKAAEIIRAILVVSADHELTKTTVAVRIAASTRASPYRAVTSGLACIDGPWHAGLSEQVARLFSEIDQPKATERVLAAYLRRGEDIPGFGLLPVYKDIDPRARALLGAVRRHAPGHPALTLAEAVISNVAKLTRQQPNYFFATVAVRMPRCETCGSRLLRVYTGKANRSQAFMSSASSFPSMNRRRARAPTSGPPKRSNRATRRSGCDVPAASVLTRISLPGFSGWRVA